jgi:hypothetical protein
MVFTERRVFRPEVAALEGPISSRALAGVPNYCLLMVPILRTWGHAIQLQRLNDTE